MRRMWRGAGVVLAVIAGCDDEASVIGGDADVADAVDVVMVVDRPTTDAGFDAGFTDVGSDSGAVDVGTLDAGTDAGAIDAGTDAGTVDTGTDAGPADVGVDVAEDVAVDVPVDVPVDTGPTCAMAMILCGDGMCHDTQVDVAHCGTCGNACPAVDGAVPRCSAGACGFACSASRGDCNTTPGDGCEVDLSTSTAHCGGCNNACGAGQTCTAGACVDLPCPTGQSRCGGACVDRQTSTLHCGTCGSACTAGAGASPTCSAGVCGLVCNAGLANCDGMAANGCEVDLTASATSCGRCGVTCISGQACVAGRCESTSCMPPAGCSGGSCASCTRVAFSEDWESGTGRWNLPRGGTTAITTMMDTSACSGSFLRETELFSAGRVFTQSSIPVTGGARYCATAWIRGSTGTWPFVGMRASSSTASIGTEHWLIGQPCFGTSLAPPVAPVTSDGAWRWYSREFTMPAYTHILLEIEIWGGGAAGTADFDQIQLLEGPCPQVNPSTVCTAATCGS